jgi:uncharacterized protein YcbK (DUF882 family)
LGALAGVSAAGLASSSSLAFAQDAPASGAEGMDSLVDSALEAAKAEPAAPVIASVVPRALALHNLHTDEKLEAVYFDNGAYVPDALSAFNKLMRDHRTNETHPIDPQLLDLLVQVRGACESKECYELISGYRAPASNALLHNRSKEVASNSLHMQGMAADVRIGGVALDHLRKAALALRGGGVGLYPVSDFVHMDVGRVRQWKGT